MRVSDDRYTRDRQRLDLALRLIRHEARTFTIRQWTGLSDDRIRKLYRSYVLNHDAQRVFRHRGKSPRQAALRTPVRHEWRPRIALSRRIAGVGDSAMPGIRGIPGTARAREHFLRACVVPPARAGAAR